MSDLIKNSQLPMKEISRFHYIWDVVIMSMIALQ